MRCYCTVFRLTFPECGYFWEIDGNEITGNLLMEDEEGQTGYGIARISSGHECTPMQAQRKTLPRGIAG